MSSCPAAPCASLSDNPFTVLHDRLFDSLRGELETQHAILIATLTSIVCEAIRHCERLEEDSTEEAFVAGVGLPSRNSQAAMLARVVASTSSPRLPKFSPCIPRPVAGGSPSPPDSSGHPTATPAYRIDQHVKLDDSGEGADTVNAMSRLPSRQISPFVGPRPPLQRKRSAISPQKSGFSVADLSMSEVIGAKSAWHAFQKYKDADGVLIRFVATHGFENWISFAIVLNCIFLGFTTSYAAAHAQEPTTWTISVIELIFHSVFCMELVLRLYAYRIRFFTGEDWKWNLFDMVLVLTAIADVLAFVSERYDTYNLTFIRLLRLLKSVKVLRMVRAFRFFHELRLMLQSIVGSFASLFWALVMLLAFMYLGALIFVQAATQVFAEPEGVDPAIVDKAERYWGNIYRGVTTIWMAISGGNDWAELAEPVREAGEHYFVIFELFMAFLTLAVLNILTGIFVEHAVEAAENDRDNIVFQHTKQYDSFARDVQEIFDEIDTEGTGTISWSQFRQCMDDTAMRAYFSNVGIDTSDAAFFFKLLSQGTLDGQVDQDSFLKGCQRLKGSARMMDTQAICCQVQSVFKALESLAIYCECQFESLQPLVADDRGKSITDTLSDIRLSQIAPTDASVTDASV